ncbi:MAG: DNA primase [Fimbriimonas sp.]|nr:DNA primase [Fimbriimonas sp.]
MADERDEIRSRIDIVELVGREVNIARQGKNWKGLCPFHQDRNPSFTVTPQTGRYKCWSCGEAGDIFDWVMKRQNVDFMEAMRILAKEAGVTLTPRGDATPPSVRQAQEDAMTEALAFFRSHLERNSNALEYCERRGLDRQTLMTWEMGYAPEGGSALAVHLKKKGFQLVECKNLFLVDEDAGGGYYDKFRGRLIFPIRDERGALVAFGGRLLGDGVPKYINSSDTPLYHKSRVLYGMNRARHVLGKEKRAVLVEGYLDVIACHRAGVETAVASLGTALSEEHAKLFKRWVEEVVVLYDSDNAGQKAADRAIGILSAEGLRVRVALMPPGEDPDTLLKNAGPAVVQQAVETGISPVDYKMQALLLKESPKEEAFWPKAVLILANATTEMELDRHIMHLAGMYPGMTDVNLTQKALRREVNKVRRAASQNVPPPTSSGMDFKAAKGRLDSAELVVFLAFLSHEYRTNGWLFARARDLFYTPLAISISDAVSTVFPMGAPQGEPALWLHRIEDEGLRQSLADLLLDLRANNLSEAYIADSVERLRMLQQKRKLAEIRKGGLDTAKRQEYLMRLREQKPDPHKKQQDDDNLFG